MLPHGDGVDDDDYDDVDDDVYDDDSYFTSSEMPLPKRCAYAKLNDNALYYLQNAFSILLSFSFLLQLSYNIFNFAKNFALSFNFDIFSLVSFAVQSIFFLHYLFQNRSSFPTAQPTVDPSEYALMFQEAESSSSSSKRPLSSTQSSTPASKKSFFEAGLEYLTFVVDSGASRHLSNLPSYYFTNFTAHSMSDGTAQGIQSANGGVSYSTGQGTIGPLQNVLCMPGFAKNLFSVRTAVQRGYQILFHGDRCDIFGKGDIEILSAPIISAFLSPPRYNLYELKIYPEPSDEAFLATFTPFHPTPSPNGYPTETALLADTRPINSFTLVHQRLPHLSSRTLCHLQHSDNWINMPKWTGKDQKLHESTHCVGCALGKMTLSPRSKLPPEKIADGPGQLFLADLWFSNISSDGRKKCCLLIVDAYSRKLWRFFMEHKSEVQVQMLAWLTQVRKEGLNFQTWSPLPRPHATLKTDPGSEFLSSMLAALLAKNGITHELSPPKVHVEMVERAIRTVKECTASYLQAAKYELTRAASIKSSADSQVTAYIFWCEAASYAIDVLNMMPYKKDAKVSKNQRWYANSSTPIEYEDLSMLRTFGCRVYCKNYSSLKADKGGTVPSKSTREEGMKHFPTWGDRGWEGIFMGLAHDSPGCWRVLNLRTKRYVNTNNMVANENLHSSLPSQSLTRESLLSLLQLHSFFPLSIAQNLAIEQLTNDNKHLLHDEWHFDYHEYDPQYPLERIIAQHRQARYEAMKKTALPHVASSNSALYSDEAFLCDDDIDLDPLLLPPKTIEKILDFALLSEDFQTPETYKQATTGPERSKWIPSIEDETKSLQNRDVFKVIPKSSIPSDAKVLKAKWVFKRKQDGRFKSRYTVKGCQQRFGFDYDEVFSPVVRYTTLRSLCAISAANDYHLHQMDVDTAFLYGTMDEDDPLVFCQLPETFEIPIEYAHIPRDQLCGQLQRSLYGLKQASRKWYFTLLQHLQALGFIASQSDPCLFHMIDSSGHPIWVAVFVDDLVISSPSMTAIDSFKAAMSSRFNMKDMGSLANVLGMEVNRTSTTLSMTQQAYIKDVSKRFGVHTNRCKHKLPMRPNIKLSIADCPTTPEEREEADALPYRSLIGSLMYLMISTRPDIACPLIQLSRFLQNWGKVHYTAALDLLIYVQSTPTLGVTYHKGPTTLVGFADANWAGNADNARSTTGYIFYLANGPISWKSKEQKTVALSSTEAEYMSLTAAAQEALHLRGLLPIFSVDMSSPTIIYEDNEGALQLANNPVHHDKTKHIKIKHHFIRDTVASKEIIVLRVVTKDNVSDLLTKAVTNTVYDYLIERFLGITPCLSVSHETSVTNDTSIFDVMSIDD